MISKPQIKRSFKHQKSSSDARQFTINLRIYKNSHYDVQNYKSGRNNQCHSFKQHRPRYKPISTSIPYGGLKVKGRKDYKAPSPHRQNRMLHATICCQDNIICRSTRFKLSLLHFNKLDINNNHVLTNSEYNNHSILNFPLQFTPNQVDSTTNLLDNVVLTEVVLRPTEKPRSVGPHKLILKKNDKQWKSHQENKKFRSVCKPTYGTTADRNINNGLKSSRHLLYKSKDRNKYPYRNTSTLFPISWKFTKKRLCIIRDISIPDCLPHHGLNHRIELKTDSPSMLGKDK